MFTRIRLQNFKSWRELDIELAPITVLFGTNSSGKSSVLQAVLLLWQSHVKHGFDVIDFGGSRSDYVDLGGFKELVHNHEVHSDIAIGFVSENEGKFAVILSLKNDTVKVTETAYSVFDYFADNLRGQNRFHYLAPLRQYPQRSYLWSGARPNRIEPDGENTIAALIAAERAGEPLPLQVSEWLQKMELVQSFNVTALDDDKRFYETRVKIGNMLTNLRDVGFGISQVLPVITTLFFVPVGSIVLLEQPELHLHPRAQAHLADLILHVAQERQLQLIIESHSEHLLRRFQRRIAEVEHDFASPENIKMYFCDMGENGSTIQPVQVDRFGQINNWPQRFFGDITEDLEAMTMAALQRSLNGQQD